MNVWTHRQTHGQLVNRLAYKKAMFDLYLPIENKFRRVCEM